MAFLHRFQVIKSCDASEGHLFRRTYLIITCFLVALLPNKLNMHVQMGKLTVEINDICVTRAT